MSRVVPPALPGARPTDAPKERHPHTLGSIIWSALVRMILTLLAVWYVRDHVVDFPEWWMVATFAIYGIAIYPAQIQYDYFRQSNKRLIESTLCSSCRHFSPENLHCMKLDEHVSEQYLPCEGEEWEPSAFDLEEV